MPNLSQADSLRILSNIGVALAGARHGGNVGLVARAMKNTALSHLVLVRCVDHRSKTATTFGAPAKEILDKAEVYPSLSRALKRSTYVVGFTRREGKMRLSLKPFLDLIPAILAHARMGKVHLVFGNERTGLSTDEIFHCDVAAYLPSNPHFPSMNLSHAVMLVGYELLKALLGDDRLGGIAGPKPEKYPTRQEIERMWAEFNDVLRRLDYRDMPNLKLLTSILNNSQRLTKRAMPNCSDLNMMRGILSRLHQRLPNSRRRRFR